MKKTISVICILAVILSLFAGCGGPEKKVNTVLVAGNHENFPAVSYKNKKLYDTVFDSCYTYGSFAKIIVDGSPFLGCSCDIEKPDAWIDNSKRKQIAKSNVEKIFANCARTKAETEETDPLGAITLAAEFLSSKPEDEKKTVIIYDSLLGTAGVLNNLEHNLFDALTEQIVRRLAEMKAIPDLSSCDVVVIGAGQVCGNQSRLTSDNKAKNQELWTAIFEAGNARTVIFDNEPIALNAAGCDLPRVSAVPIRSETLGIGSYVPFNEETIKFLPDSCVITDEAKAVEALKNIGDYMNGNPRANITIAGSTASVGGDGVSLSYERANSVKTLLVENYNISSSRISVLGLGKKASPFRVDDTNPDGTLNENSEKNRAIYIYDSDSETAKTVIDMMNNGKSI